MKQNIYLAGFVFLLTILIKFEAKTQDIHYSQFYNSPLNINPALTGIFNGDIRVIGSIRDQWRSVPVSYTTFSGAFDMKYLPKKSDKYFFGFGGILNYDQAGDSKLNISDLNLTGSYNYLVNKNNVLSAGILLGVASEGFNETELTFGNQWNGIEFNPTSPTGENFDNFRYTYLETGAGANYRYQSDSTRTYANIGVGLFHLTRPSAEYIDLENPRLPVRTALTGQLNFQLTKAFDVQAHGLAQFQGPYREFVLGGLAKLYLNQTKGKVFRLDLGASYRTSKFIAPTLAIQYNQIYVGASYDINLGEFRSDFNGRGGPEVHVRYILTKVQALNQKPCPIY
ncbi:PorP/SprF family type IX secretion system membrane protein [Portibacter marinus]|uniref:PorP/SprF family type IX secretion system membrane protein n=1 Tax=Portibacter marinus TaxID=2898660 RepID=UPI001F40B933|nr:PorP/SprF family type IX secretion system membrane protein [Portibacter marinus]